MITIDYTLHWIMIVFTFPTIFTYTTPCCTVNFTSYIYIINFQMSHNLSANII